MLVKYFSNVLKLRKKNYLFTLYQFDRIGLSEWTLLLPNVMELEAFSLCCFTKALSGPAWD